MQISQPAEGKDNRTDVTELLNRCQRHRCTDYCLRKDRASGQMQCRFGFPQDPKEHGEISKNHKNQWVFEPTRPQLDSDLNKYCPILIAIWRANIDTSAITSTDALNNYIGKYAAKAEEQSDTLLAEMKHATEQHDPADSVGKLINQLMNKYVVQRDFSAQEATHQLLSLPMVECSRTFETLNLVDELTEVRALGGRGDELTKLETYMQRPAEMDDLSYYNTVKKFKYNKREKTWQAREKDVIVQIIPWDWWKCEFYFYSLGLTLVALRPDPTNPDAPMGQGNPKFATAARRAVLLHVPFRDFNALTDLGYQLDINEQPENYDMQQNRYQRDQIWVGVFLLKLQQQPAYFPQKVIQAAYGLELADFEFELDPDDIDPPEPPPRQALEWQRMASHHPARGGQIARTREFLGMRDVDIQHNWNLDLPREQLSTAPENFITLQRREAVRNFPNQHRILPDALNPGQRAAFDHIVTCFRRRVSPNPPQIAQNIIITGSAGVGKSFLIRAIETTVWELAKEQFGEEQYPDVRTAIKLVAFTGKAAFQVGGVTIHSLFLLGIELSRYQDLSPERRRTLQNNFKNTHCLFIDEMSMLGLRMLVQIDTRLREAMSEHAENPFGGLIVVLFGDFAQLPPVVDQPLYHIPTQRNAPHVHQGSRLYRDTFTSAFVLEQQMRQQGQGEDDLKFADLLSHLRVGAVTMENWQFMQSRVLIHLPQIERTRFQDALCLFPTNEQVAERNMRTLESLHVPVARLVAKYQDVSENERAKIDDDHAGGLCHELFLCVGARVFQTFQ